MWGTRADTFTRELKNTSQDSSQRWIITSPLAEGKSVRSCTSKILGTPKDNEHLTLGVDCPDYP